MKTLETKKLSTVALIAAFLVLTVAQVNAATRWGVGAKVIGQQPFVTGSVEWDNIKLGLGAFFKSENNVDGTFVLVEGKYLFFNRRSVLRPYVGINGLSIQASSGIVTASVAGGGAVGGISWSPNSFLSLEVGGGYLTFTEFTVGSVTFPINIEGTIFEAGITWRF